MAGDSGDSIAEGRLDLVPMIDCIMLLLIFLILTTKFTSEEKAISSLLPTDKGQLATTPSKPVTPPQMVSIIIYPQGLQKGMQPSEYYKAYNQMISSGIKALPAASLRVGNREPIGLDTRELSAKSGAEMVRQVETVHQYLTEELTKFEKAGERKDQDPVVIQCFSGLSWRYALIAYDAVRAYEAKKSGRHYTGNPAELLLAREVTFAPPRIRNYSAKEQGEELFELLHSK